MKSDLTFLKAIGFTILGFIAKGQGDRVWATLFFVAVIIYMGFFVFEWLGELAERGIKYDKQIKGKD